MIRTKTLHQIINERDLQEQARKEDLDQFMQILYKRDYRLIRETTTLKTK